MLMATSKSSVAPARVFDGPPPEIATAISHDAEIDRASSWIGDLIENGIQPQNIGGFVRSDKEMDRC